MQNQREASQFLWLLVVLIGCIGRVFAADSPLPQPVATLALSAKEPSDSEEASWATVAFSSETSIAVGLCPRDCGGGMCSLSLVRWEGGTLHLLAQTPHFNPGLDLSIHTASDGQILASYWQSTLLYSADLSQVHEVPKHLPHFSPSGKTAAEPARDSWKLYRLTDILQPLRKGSGELVSVSDEMIVIQYGRKISVETLDGTQLGSFSVSNDSWDYHAGLLGNAKLYFDDCRRSIRIVDFKGKTQLRIHPPTACAQGNQSSADGTRMLFDVTSHKSTGLQHLLETLQTITSLGMVGPEDVNREDVRVFDTITGKSWLDWHRSFPATYNRVTSAAISSSGEFVTIATGNSVSIYRLPAVCRL